MTQFPVVHFEMPYNDAARLAAFYAAAFGWDMQQFGPEMGGYVTAATAESEQGRSTVAGTINGGFFPRGDDANAQHPSVVVGVEDIAAATARVVDAGGTVLGDSIDIPGVGLYVGFVDTEGNRASLLQPHGS
jgi:predicted enzyme related to lactoylglutathione lyase